MINYIRHKTNINKYKSKKRLKVYESQHTSWRTGITGGLQRCRKNTVIKS